MPDITYIGSATGSGAAGANASINVGGISGIADGDFLVVMSAVYVRAAGDGQASTNGNGSFTEPVNALTSNGTRRLRVAHKFRDSDTTITIAGTGNASDAVSGIVFVFRDVDPTTPFDVTPTTATGSSSNPNAPSITSSADRTIAIACAASPIRDTSIGSLSGFATSVYATPASQTNNAETGAAYRTSVLTPGGSSLDPAAFASWTTTNNIWVAATILLRPNMSFNFTVPQGNLVISKPAPSRVNSGDPIALEIDGTATKTMSAGSSLFLTLTTVQAGDIIIVVVHEEGTTTQTISNVTATGLSFAKRASQTYATSRGNSDMEYWWAYAGSAFSGDITVTLTGSIDTCTAYAFGVTGFVGTDYQTDPWDDNASLGQASANTGDTGTVTTKSFSTTAANTMLLAFAGSTDYDGPGSADSPLTAFASTPVVNHTGTYDSTTSLGRQNVTSAQSSITRTFSGGGSTGWITFADALLPVVEAAGIERIPPQGNQAISSVAPSLDLGIKPPQGNVANSSVGPTVAVGASFVVPQGNLARSSVGPALDLGIRPPQGNLARSSVGPTLDLGIKPPQGNLAQTSVLPTVVTTTGESFNITPLQGDLVGSRTAPVVAWTDHRNITPPQGNEALSSLAPTVARTANWAITVPQGGTAISGSQPDVQAGASISKIPPQGDAAISGSAPVVARTDHRNITVPQGNVAESSIGPSVQIGLVRATLQGNAALSAVAPTLLININRVPLQGNIAFSALAPSRVQDSHPASGQGNAVLSGSAPTVATTANWAIVPPQGNVTLSAEAPQTGGTMSRTPLQGNLAASRTAPTVARTAHWWVTPPTRDLVLSEVAPTIFASLHHPITVPKVDLELTTLPAQLIPGVYFYPPYRNIVITATTPGIEFGRTHHWRHVTDLRGSITPNQTGRGSLNQANILGSIDNEETLGAD